MSGSVELAEQSPQRGHVAVGHRHQCDRSWVVDPLPVVQAHMPTALVGGLDALPVGEWAARTELDFLTDVVQAVVDAGARTVNIPDTVGYAVPEQYASCIAHLRKHVRGIEKVVLSVHCPNDLGLAVSNSLAAVREGARQIECTINGIGERAGNAALEEVVMAMNTRQDRYPYHTKIVTEHLFPASQLLSSIITFGPQPNKAIVGENAFAHEAGIHQDGFLKERTTYEIMEPKSVGVPESKLVLGKHSGRNAFRARLTELGIVIESEEALNAAFKRFKDLADKKHEIFDEDLQSLVTEADIEQENEHYHLVSLRVCSQTGAKVQSSRLATTPNGCPWWQAL